MRYTPDKETVDRTRSSLEGVLEQGRRIAATKSPEHREGMEQMARLIEWRLMGDGTGCVITSLDRRWLDDEFREKMSDL